MVKQYLLFSSVNFKLLFHIKKHELDFQNHQYTGHQNELTMIFYKAKYGTCCFLFLFLRIELC